MARTTKPESRLADAAFRLLAKGSWQDLTLSSVARAAKVALADLHALAPSKPALLALMLSRAGEDTARDYRPDKSAESGRDRVFDVALTWFEALSTRKAAIRSLYEGLRRDPFALLAARGAVARASEWLLVLAEADAGRALPLKATALAAILMRTIPVWLDDDREMSKTMAALDAALRRASWLF